MPILDGRYFVLGMRSSSARFLTLRRKFANAFLGIHLGCFQSNLRAVLLISVIFQLGFGLLASHAKLRGYRSKLPVDVLVHTAEYGTSAK